MEYPKIKNLLVNQQYALAIDEVLNLQQKGKKDEELDLLLAQAYFMSEQYEIALVLLENMINYSSKRYFDILYLQCQTLVKLDDLIKAKKIIDEELEQPYMPLQWSEKFNDLNKQIIVATSGDASIALLSDEEFEEKLLSQDEIENFLAVNFLRKVNARNYLNEILNYLIEENNSYKIKTLLVEVLIDQGCDMEIPIAKFGIITTINLTDFDNKNTELALREIEQLILDHSDNSTIIQFSKEMFVHYYVHYFPNIKYDEKLYRAIINIACEMLGEEPLFDDNPSTNNYFAIVGQVKF